METTHIVNLAVFASGEGTNFERICQACASGELPAQVKVLIASRPNIGAIARAKKWDVDVEAIPVDDHADFEDWDRAVVQVLHHHQIDFIVLAGFLKKIGPAVVSEYSGKIVNTHPSLLPKYGGKGMYGMRVHQAVIENKEPESGCTVHWVNENYDEGNIIAQKKVKVSPGDSPEQLAQKVKAVEPDFLVSVLKSVLLKASS